MRRYETLYVQSGSFSIRKYNADKDVFETVPLNPGMTFTVPRGAIHQVECLTHGVLIETSLTYEEEDVLRIFDESLIRRGPSLR
jgi:mannose-6-phosphate isomerase-like protein (cupin superfamily)